MSSKTKKIDYLSEDPILPLQLFVCLSFLSPEGIRNCSIRGVKIRGAYATLEEAKRRAKELQSIDPDFHVFVGEMGKWLPWDPEPNSIEDQEYSEKELNKLMKKYKQNREKAKKMEYQRKHDKINKALKEEEMKKRKRKRNKKKAKKKLPKNIKKKLQNELANKKSSTKEIVAEKKMHDIAKEAKEIMEGEQNINEIDAKINRIKNLYEKHMKLQK
uniref:Uncharacterized protein n=1 Tax=Mimivirus LCMiAC01 TaxID=2506608 RepID=A0A481Z056_9VIRU|nr:MAG: uncharacterized protein LCMiAC01_05650 [Mimivirus LCMiAC01]